MPPTTPRQARVKVAVSLVVCRSESIGIMAIEKNQKAYVKNA